MKNYLEKRKLNIICSVAAIALMWLVWLIAYYSVKNDYIIPSIADTFKQLWRCISGAAFWTAFGFTFLRTAEAFIISFVLAAICAAFSACSKIFSSFIKPFITVLRTLPTLAIILILLIWTSPKTAPVIVTVLVLFPLIYSQMFAAIEGIDGEIKEMAQVYKISNRDKIFKIYLPLISPNILSQTGANVSLGLKVMVSAEVLANTFRSLGGLMQNAKLYVDMPRLAALTLITVLLGFIIDIAFSQVARVTYKWSRKENARD